jgi:hypothetical protein
MVTDWEGLMKSFVFAVPLLLRFAGSQYAYVTSEIRLVTVLSSQTVSSSNNHSFMHSK